ncbi:MAG: hypothetical protein K0U47_00785 [Epsilonproteobacteria bacterium]|nr:hypothetical protein [Campylobacterota bacterium]
MKRISALLSLLLLHNTLLAYEAGQLSLDTPTVLQKGESSFTIRHRFFGEASDTEDFFGMDSGGNVLLSYSYAPIDHMFIDIEHTRKEKDYSIALGYNLNFDALNTQAEVQYFSFERSGIDGKQKNFFANLAFQSKPLYKHLILTSNLGYDHYEEKFGLGLGLDLTVNNFISYFTFTEKLSFIAEYYPIVDEIESEVKQYDAYSAGIKFQTFAHHFEILLSNSVDMEPRRLMQGTKTNDIHFGFNINRKF